MKEPTVGEPTRAFMLRIAEAFAESAQPFEAVNARLARLGQIEPVAEPEGRVELTTGVWVDFQPGMDTSVTIRPSAGGHGLRLIVDDLGDSHWFSFSYALDIQAVRSARYLGLLIGAESTGLAAFRPCLRYLLEGGFEDRFPPNTIVLTGGEGEELCFLKIDPELAAEAHGAEVLFFFEGKKFDVTLKDIENLHI